MCCAEIAAFPGCTTSNAFIENTSYGNLTLIIMVS
jgi:hypothetical protein